MSNISFEKDNIILCGLIANRLEYVEADDSVRIIDFKTGKNTESDDSPSCRFIFFCLTAQSSVSGAAYWYLEKNDVPTEIALPDARSER